MKKVVFLMVVFSSLAAGKVERHSVDAPAILASEFMSNEPAFGVGEKLEYRLHYGWIDAGIATLEVKKAQNGPVNDPGLLHMVGIGKSTGAFDWFYKVRDRYETYFDPNKKRPRAFVRRVNEGGFIINRDYVFDHEKNEVKTEKGVFKTPADVQDMLSSFYYLRSIDFSRAKKGDLFKVNAFMDYELYPFHVKYMGEETVTVDAGTFRCYKFVPVVQKGRVFKDEEDLKVWISKDHNEIPILAQAEVLVGSIKMELTSYKGLSGPLAKR